MFEPEIKRVAKACLQSMNIKQSLTEFYLIKNENMRGLNKKFRKKDKPTNVLSFKEPESVPHPELKRKTRLGEIYLAPDYIRKKEEKIAVLVVHGVLHLLGYTHGRLRDKIEMEKRERKILEEMTKV